MHCESSTRAAMKATLRDAGPSKLFTYVFIFSTASYFFPPWPVWKSFILVYIRVLHVSSFSSQVMKNNFFFLPIVLNMSSALICLMNWRYKWLISFEREGHEEWHGESDITKRVHGGAVSFTGLSDSEACALELGASVESNSKNTYPTNDPEWWSLGCLYVCGLWNLLKEMKDRYLLLTDIWSLS